MATAGNSWRITSTHLYITVTGDRENASTVAGSIVREIAAFNPEVGVIAQGQYASIDSFVSSKHAPSQGDRAAVSGEYHTAVLRSFVVNELPTRDIYFSLGPHHAPTLCLFVPGNEGVEREGRGRVCNSMLYVTSAST